MVVSPRLYITSLYVETGKVGMVKEAPETGSAASKGYDKALALSIRVATTFCALVGKHANQAPFGLMFLHLCFLFSLCNVSIFPGYVDNCRER